MRITKLFKTAVTIAVCAAMTLPHPVMASVQATQIVDGIKVSRDIKDVRLGEGGALKGAVVDQNGKPVAGAPVTIGQQGKIIAYLDTASDGRYTLTDIAPGVYQVASYAGVQTVRLFDGVAPAGAVEGVVQVIDQAGIARGQCQSGSCQPNACSCNDPSANQCNSPSRFAGLTSCLQNPLLWAVVIAAAIAIPLALDDDDAS